MRFRRRRKTLPASIRMRLRRERWALKVLTFTVVAVAVVFSRSAVRPTDGGDQVRYGDREFRVVHVVDGDTLDIDVPDDGDAVTRIRLWGVDTPEVRHGGTPDMHFGPEAKAFAERTLENRTVHVALSPKRTRDKYERLLAYVFLERGGRMFNEMLLEEGYAYADLRFKHHYFDRFKAVEKRARKAGVGLWAEITPDKMPPWKQRFEGE